MAKNRSKPKLTGKQEKFAALVAQGATQTDAYRKAYDVDPNSKPESQWEVAARIASDIKVKSRIDELKAKAQEILINGAAKSAQKLVDLVDAKEQIIGVDGTFIGDKINTDMNRRAANDVLDKLGFGGGHQPITVNNNFLIMAPDEVKDALSRLRDSDD